MADVDVAPEQQVLDVPEANRKTDVHSTTSRITSGDELKRRNGEGGRARGLRGIARRYQRPLLPDTLV